MQNRKISFFSLVWMVKDAWYRWLMHNGVSTKYTRDNDACYIQQWKKIHFQSINMCIECCLQLFNLPSLCSLFLPLPFLPLQYPPHFLPFLPNLLYVNILLVPSARAFFLSISLHISLALSLSSSLPFVIRPSFCALHIARLALLIVGMCNLL